MTDKVLDPWLALLAEANARLRAGGVVPWAAKKGKKVSRVKYMLAAPALVERLAPLGELLLSWPKTKASQRQPPVFNPVCPRIFPDTGYVWIGAGFLDTAGWPASYGGGSVEQVEMLPATVFIDDRPMTPSEFWRVARPMLYSPEGRWFALRIDDRSAVRLLESDLATERWRSIDDDLDALVERAFRAATP